MVTAKQFGITLVLIIVAILISPILLSLGLGITDPFVQLFIIFIPIIIIATAIVKAGSRDRKMGFVTGEE